MADLGRIEEEVVDTPTSHQMPYSSRCTVCRRLTALTKAGLIRVHGPVDNRCPGSRAPPSHRGVSTTDFTTSSSHPVLPTEAELGSRQPFTSDHRHNPLTLPVPPMKTIKRIPRASRNTAAKKLASIIEAAVASNDQNSWDRLFRFASRCLRSPRRGG